jgi:hypothetical protein
MANGPVHETAVSITFSTDLPKNGDLNIASG